MTWELRTVVHICDIPNPDSFYVGERVRCTVPRLRNGVKAPCNTDYDLVLKWGKPKWRKHEEHEDYGW